VECEYEKAAEGEILAAVRRVAEQEATPSKRAG
jgi:hypothetical protein